MKLFLLFLAACCTVISLIFWFFVFIRPPFTYNISENEKMILSVEANAGKQIATRNNLQYIGSGGGMKNGKISKTSLSFTISKCLNKETARQLVVASTQDYLKLINNNEELREALLHNPFTENDIEILIFSKDPKGGNFCHPYIKVVNSRDNLILYRTKELNQEFGYKLIEEETFEDALKMLALQNITLQNQDDVK